MCVEEIFVWNLYSEKGFKPITVNDELANFLR